MPSPRVSNGPTSSRGARRLTAAAARRLLDEHARSGLPLAAFEREHGLTRNVLSAWRARFRREAASASNAPEPTGGDGVAFLEVRAAGAAPIAAKPTRMAAPEFSVAALEIELPDRIRVRVSEAFAQAALAQLLAPGRLPC